MENEVERLSTTMKCQHVYRDMDGRCLNCKMYRGEIIDDDAKQAGWQPPIAPTVLPDGTVAFLGIDGKMHRLITEDGYNWKQLD